MHCRIVLYKMSSESEISFDRLEIGDTISTGQSSKVQKAKLKTEDGSKSDEVATKTYVDFKESEIRILAKLKHENVIKFIGAVTKDDKKILVMEYAPHGNLYDFLRKQNNRLSFEHSMEWAKQCSKALAYIHKQGIVHRDIKSHNFLLSAHFTEKSVRVLKLCDFGISHEAKNSITSTRTIVGGLSLQWAAPEVIRKPECCSIYSDVYSLAVVIWEVFTGQTPYEGLDDNLDIQITICKGNTPNTESISCQDVSQILQRCWRKEKSDRPKAAEVVAQLNTIPDNDIEVDAQHIHPTEGDDSLRKDIIKGLENLTVQLARPSKPDSTQSLKPRNSKPASPQRVVEDLELQELVKHLGSNWKSFARKLGFSEEEIYVFEADNKISVTDAMYDMLNSWKKKFGKEATIGKLVHHLDQFLHINPEKYAFLINDAMKD